MVASLREGGSIAFYASNGDREPRVPAGVLMQKNLAVYGMVLPSSPHESRKRAQSDIARFVATPGRMLSVAARFPLAEAAAAHEAVERGGKVGTVVIETSR
jgi:NADPH2:quinone reductase